MNALLAILLFVSFIFHARSCDKFRLEVREAVLWVSKVQFLYLIFMIMQDGSLLLFKLLALLNLSSFRHALLVPNRSFGHIRGYI